MVCGTRHAGGCLALFLAIAAMLIMAEIVQSIQKSYTKPIFLKWLTSCSFVVNLLPTLIIWRHRRRNNSVSQTEEDTRASINTPTSKRHRLSSADTIKYGPRSFLSYTKSNLKYVAVMTFLSWGVGITWNVSLQHTSVALNSTILNTQCAFVFVMSAILFRERITLMKSLATCLCFGGVIVIGLGAEHQSSKTTTITGIFFSVIATIFASALEVAFQYIGNRTMDNRTVWYSTADALFYLGSIGWVSIVLMWVLPVIVNFVGIEPFQMPSKKLLFGIGMSIVCDIILNAGTYMALALTSATFVALGSLMAVPLGYGLDYFLHGTVITKWGIIGSVMIVVGFLIHVRVEGEDAEEEDEEDEKKHEDQFRTTLIDP